MVQYSCKKRDRLVICDETRPRLWRYVRLHYDAVRGRWVLLAPERIVETDPVAADILRLCDGQRTLHGIADKLTENYDAALEHIRSDAAELLQALSDSGYIEDHGKADA